MRKPLLLACCTAVSMLQAPAIVQACGDKLSVIGGGVRFDRVSQNRYRGNVVMLVAPDSPLRAANDTLKLRQALEAAGHSVRAVESSNELTLALDQSKADVVLVSWDGAGQIKAQLAGRSPSPTVLPFTAKADLAFLATASNTGNCFAVAEHPGDKRFVKAVDRVVEQRRKDSSLQCSSARTLASAQ